jgi:ABC-2 type transport system ATP-binding protein
MMGVMTDTAIRVRGLRKTYGDLVAVDGVDLDVQAGEIFALLGPNGAGKTTIVEILEGYRSRTDGDVTVLGEDPAGAGRHWRSRIGLVLQSAKINDEVTVHEVVHHFARFYPNPRQADDVIDLVGLTEKRDERVARLSGGQQRRLDVGLGMVGRPELLFLDEPTTGFDPEARRQFWALISTLRDEGTTILLTTHYLEEAEVLADRVAVIANGRVLAADAPAQLGGRADGAATVRWREGQDHREEVSDAPTALVASLAERFGGEVPELTVTRPSLEDVYLAMIGAPR